MKKYSGQAIAIVLVLLVVGSLVGFALYARFARESERVVDERAASEAENLVETVAGLLNSTSYEEVRDTGGSYLCEEGESISPVSFCSKGGMKMRELKGFFNVLGVEEQELTELFEPFEEYEEDYCSAEIRMRDGTKEDQIIIGQDEVYSVYFNDVLEWDSCSPSFRVSRLGSALGFVMSSFYRGVVDEKLQYKPYELDDIRGFNYNEQESGFNWDFFDSGDELIFSSDGSYLTEKGGYPLVEVRFKSLGGESGLKWNVESCPGVKSEFLIFEVGATCGGKSVNKGFIMPGEVFAPPIFDYVLFNGKGDLVPERITD